MSRIDWPAVEEIYRDGTATGFATFEREPTDDVFLVERRSTSIER